MLSLEIGRQSSVLTNENQDTQTNNLSIGAMADGGELLEQLFRVVEAYEMLKENAQVLETHKLRIENISESAVINNSLIFSAGESGDGELFPMLEESLKEIGFEEVNDERRKPQEVMQIGKDCNSHEVADVPTRVEVSLGCERNRCYTRQSSRIQDKEIPMMQKAMARKAGTEGITTCPSSHSTQPSCSLDEISKIYGFFLGLEEETRLSNMSLIQAKEEAMASLLLTKQKILLSLSENRGQPIVESSGSHEIPNLEISGEQTKEDDKLSTLDQGRRFFFAT